MATDGASRRTALDLFIRYFLRDSSDRPLSFHPRAPTSSNYHNLLAATFASCNLVVLLRAPVSGLHSNAASTTVSPIPPNNAVTQA
jgi:hypothetical protein